MSAKKSGGDDGDGCDGCDAHGNDKRSDFDKELDGMIPAEHRAQFEMYRGIHKLVDMEKKIDTQSKWKISFCILACDNMACPKHSVFESGDPIPYKRCSKCRRTYYCNSACQKSDWAQHKLACMSGNDVTYGLFLENVPILCDSLEYNAGVLYHLYDYNKHNVGASLPWDRIVAISNVALIGTSIASSPMLAEVATRFQSVIPFIGQKMKDLSIVRGHVIQLRGMFIVCSPNK